MSTIEASKINIARTFRTIKADSSKDLPTRIEILKAGIWPASSNKGQLEITVSDLHEMKANFDAGIGMPGDGDVGLPVDFMHEDFNKAAAWIQSLEIEGVTLFATVEWTKAGEESVKGGEFKCISPSFYPACLGMWTDPENAEITARNVLIGAGLTNIPFFKDLKPITASQSSTNGEGEDKNVIFVSASEKEKSMTLQDLRAKDVGSLTEDEKSFLAAPENKSQLTAEEQVKFGFEVEQTAEQKEAAAKAEADKKEADEKAAAEAKVAEEAKAAELVAASAKAQGQVVMAAQEATELREFKTRFETKEAGDIVEAHIARGAIKADQKDNWVEKFVKADTAERTSLSSLMDGLPSNEATKASKGTDKKVEVSAVDELNNKVAELVKADQSISHKDAMKKVREQNVDLRERADKELQG